MTMTYAGKTDSLDRPKFIITYLESHTALTQILSRDVIAYTARRGV